MISNHDVTVANISTPNVFRHTPFEHETTTGPGSSLTTVQPVEVTMVTRQTSDRVTLVPSIPNVSPFADR
jgi:hypothetical protein